MIYTRCITNDCFVFERNKSIETLCLCASVFILNQCRLSLLGIILQLFNTTIMTRIGLISDTHSYFDPRFLELFKDVDEIWHAGDIGSREVLDAICAFKPVRAVYGNIDEASLRRELPEHQRFMCEGVDVWITHIGGYPGKYAPGIRTVMQVKAPKLFVCGHSHILKVMNDNTYHLLHVNPGSAGLSGFHAVRTALRFVIDGDNIRNMEVIELGNRR